MRATTWITTRGRVTMICLWLGIVAAAFVELRLLLFDLPQHFVAHGVWTHIGVALAAALLPLTILAAIFRLPYGRRRMLGRFVIRPVRTLKAPSAYSGEAIAALVFRDVLAWQSKAVVSLEAYASPSSLPQQMSVSVVGTSVPIIWIWTLIRRFVTGRRDVVIDGLLLDGEPPRLKVWTDASAQTWTVELERDSLPQALEKGISLLTPNILEAVDPSRLARLYWTWARYNEALELMSLHDGSLEAKVDAIELCVEADLDEEEAQPRLMDLDGRKKRLSKDLRSRTARLHAQVLTNSGRYGEARKLLEEALGESGHTESHESHTRLAETYAYSGDYELAYQAYDHAREAAWAALSRILQESVSELSQLLDRARRGGLVKDAQDVLPTMHDILTGQARCRKLAGSDPLTHYNDALQVCAILRETAYKPARLVPQWEAVILKAASHHVWPTDSSQGAESARKAIELYDEAIDLCKADQVEEPENVRILIDLAWNHCGKRSCVQRLLQTHPAATDDSVVAMAVDRVVRSARTLLPMELAAFNRALQRAIDLRPTEERSEGEPYATAIGKAASRLATSLFRNVQEDEGEAVLEDWMQLSEGEMGQPMEVAISKAGLSESAVGLGSEHVRQLQWQIVRLLNLIVAGTGPSDIGDLFTRSELRQTGNEALRLCREEFAELNRRREAHHRTEAYYGMACLAAVLPEPDEAAAWLAEAIAFTRRGAGSVIVNRARMDEDFDAIRSEPSIKSVLGSGAARPVRAVDSSGGRSVA